MARSVLPAELVPLAVPLPRDELKAAQRAVLDAVEADERERAALFARSARRHAEAARLWAGKPGEGVLELAGTARIGQGRATRRMHEGVRLVECFPRALELLAAGRMLQGTAELLLGLTKHLSADLQTRVGTRVTEQIADVDAGDARQVVVTAIAELRDEAEARAAHEQARAQRGVWVKPVEDGMARIGAEVDQVTAHRFALDLEELVRLEKLADERAGRSRTSQQRRADVLAELPGRHRALLQAVQRGRTAHLLAGARDRWGAGTCAEPTTEQRPIEAEPVGDDLLAALLAVPVRNQTVMHVHVPVTTVLDLDNRSGVIEGLGIVPAFQARLLRPVARLARLWVDERTGVPLGMDPDPDPPPDPGIGPEAAAVLVRNRVLAMLRPTVIRDDAEPRHDPSPRLRRLVEIRDVRCDGPGCALPARVCELDHATAYAEQGPTGVSNLHARSPRCHHAKHDGWTVVRHADGASTWTSPTGRTYRRRGPWQPAVISDLPDDLPDPRPDALDDTDPREDWRLPLWRGDDPSPF